MIKIKITVVHHRSQHTPLAILNQSPLGIIGFYLQGIADVKSLFIQDVCLDSILDSDLVVIMGAMESIYDPAVCWIKHEQRLIEQVLRRHLPLMGICFGAQHIAKVLGGVVQKMPSPVVKLSSIELNEQGENHAIFHGFQKQFKAVSLHQDHIILPRSARCLAMSHDILQAFSYENAVGVQFHPEITPVLLEALIQKRIKQSVGYETMTPDCIFLKQAALEYETNLLQQGKLLANNMISLVGEKV